MASLNKTTSAASDIPVDLASSAGRRSAPGDASNTADARRPAAPRLRVALSFDDACRYDATRPGEPPVFPGRPVYLAARGANIVLALLLFALSFVAERVIHRPSWMNPILTPSLTAACFSSYDLGRALPFFVCTGSGRRAPARRAHPHTRILYDGVAIGTGLGVAAGFLTAWGIADIRRTAPDATGTSAGTAAAILVGMYGMM